MNLNHKDIKIAIVGLGYVGLPLAIEFGKKYDTLGFDTNPKRVNELSQNIDSKNVYTKAELIHSQQLKYTSNPLLIKDCNVYIVTVPTPIDSSNQPDLQYLLSASKIIGSVLKKNDVVIFESTVYPGCTEDDCVPILEQESGLKFNKDFFCGYSPERINPGDKSRKLTDIVKLTSGSNPQIANFVDSLYKSIISAGTHKVASIKIAEAAKLIENCQRDVNISFVNELTLIFDRVGISTKEVLEAAKTKWNFLDFKPGLVGGHCIGVDPYYMLYQAQKLDYYPKLIGAGREVNNMMPIYVANRVIKKLSIEKGNINGTKCLILGFSYKPNTSDFRNTKVIDVYNELKSFGLEVKIYDPLVDIEEVKAEYSIDLLNNIDTHSYDMIIKLVNHTVFDDINHSNIISLEDIFG